MLNSCFVSGCVVEDKKPAPKPQIPTASVVGDAGERLASGLLTPPTKQPPVAPEAAASAGTTVTPPSSTPQARTNTDVVNSLEHSYQHVVPPSCLIQLEYENKAYLLAISKEEYDNTITTIFKEMRDQNIATGFMYLDMQTEKDIKDKKKQIIVWINQGSSKGTRIRCNKEYRDKMTFSRFVNLRDKIKNTIFGSVEIVDVGPTSNFDL